MAAFSDDFLSGNDFEAVLAIFCCHGYGANSSEKIGTDEKDYHKCSLRVQFAAQPEDIINNTNNKKEETPGVAKKLQKTQ